MFQLATSPPGARCLSQWWLGLTELERWRVPDPGPSIHPIVCILVYYFGTPTLISGKTHLKSKSKVAGTCQSFTESYGAYPRVEKGLSLAPSLSLSLPLQLYHSVWSISFCGQWIKPTSQANMRSVLIFSILTPITGGEVIVRNPNLWPGTMANCKYLANPQGFQQDRDRSSSVHGLNLNAQNSLTWPSICKLVARHFTNV